MPGFFMKGLRIMNWTWGTCAVVRVAVSVILFFPFYVEAQKGHRIIENRIQINQRSQWEVWDIEGGNTNISQDGSVSPSFIHKNINAALDAEEFSLTDEGGITAGSNQQDARNLMDGDMSTTWGPERNSPFEDWWVTLSLGRLVVASKIVLRFAEEGEGDPFLQFKVLVWRHPPATVKADDHPFYQSYLLPLTNTPRFWEIGRSIKPNKTQRVFEFVPPSTQSTDDVFTGDPIEYVQIIATDSDFDKAQEVSKEDYDVLPDDKKGAVEYFRRSISGRETLISEEEYEAIHPSRQGPIRYYRREIPRLAEIEVWTPGDNINLGITERGGKLTIEIKGGVRDAGSVVTDGDYGTSLNGTISSFYTYTFLQDLGALFWIEKMQVLNDGSSSIAKIFLDISDGTRAPDGSIKWTRVGSSTQKSAYAEMKFDPAKVRFIRVPYEHEQQVGGLAYISWTDVMLYGEGYLPEVVMTSDLIELGGRKNLISIEWEADTPPGTSVRLQTRTGNELDEEKIFHDSKGKVITEKRYNKLPKSRRGEITSIFKPGGDWSTWSAPYRFQGEDIKSPSPREFMLIRARILSDSPDIAASLRSIEVNMSDPIADRMIGEVWPNRIVTLGRPEDFSLFIRPSFSTALQRFDEIMIEATAGSQMELLRVRTGSDEDFQNGEIRGFSPSELTTFESQPDTLWFRLPDPVRRGVDLVEVQFRSRIFSNSESFKASGQSSNSPGFWQRVDAGDATDLVNSQRTIVLALGGNEIIQDLIIDPETITPNGDGVNDEMTFSFSVTGVITAKEVKVTIYDLGGVVVKVLSEHRSDPRGAYSIVWTGDDRSGNIVSPGMYLSRVEVDVDSGSAEDTSADRLVSVAY